MALENDAPNRAVVSRVLETIEHRLRFDRLLRELTVGFSLSMAIPLALVLWHLFSPIQTTTFWLVILFWLLGFCSFTLWRLSQKGSLTQAATSVDLRAKLKDELKSARWFISKSTSSPWVEAHLDRAAHTADKLDIVELYPKQTPRNFFTAIGLFVLLIALNLVPTSWTQGWLEAKSPRSIETRESKTETAENILEPSDSPNLEDDLSLEKRATQLLNNMIVEISGTDSMEQLEEIRKRLNMEETNLEAIEQLLEALARAMEGVTQLDEVREALANKNFEEAAEQLKELAKNLEKSTTTSDDKKRLQKGLERAALEAREELEEFSEALERSAEQLGKDNLEESKESLDEAASKLNEAAQEQAEQNLKDAARRQLQQLQETLNARREHASQAKRGGEQSNKEQAQGGAGQGQGTEQTTARQGGDHGKASQAGDGEQKQGNQPAQGDQGGMPFDGPTQLGSPTELEVTLRQEVILNQQEREIEFERKHEQLIEQPSRAADSEVEYLKIEPGRSYADPEALGYDSTPWPYRTLVKRYFETMGPRGKHD